METIQVVLDAKLLKAADAAAKRQKVNRSELVRRALREHLGRLRVVDFEDAIGAAIKLSRSESKNIVRGRRRPRGRKSEPR